MQTRQTNSKSISYLFNKQTFNGVISITQVVLSSFHYSMSLFYQAQPFLMEWLYRSCPEQVIGPNICLLLQHLLHLFREATSSLQRGEDSSDNNQMLSLCLVFPGCYQRGIRISYITSTRMLVILCVNHMPQDPLMDLMVYCLDISEHLHSSSLLWAIIQQFGQAYSF